MIQPIVQHYTLRGATRAVSIKVTVLPTVIQFEVASDEHATQYAELVIKEDDAARVHLVTHLTDAPPLPMWDIRLEGD